MQSLTSGYILACKPPSPPSTSLPTQSSGLSLFLKASFTARSFYLVLNPPKVFDTALTAQPCCSQRSNSLKLGVVRPGSHGDSPGHWQGDGAAAGAHAAAPPSPSHRAASPMPSETVGTNTYPFSSAAAALQLNKWLKAAPASARFASGGDSQRWLQSV